MSKLIIYEILEIFVKMSMISVELSQSLVVKSTFSFETSKISVELSKISGRNIKGFCINEGYFRLKITEFGKNLKNSNKMSKKSQIMYESLNI